MTITGLDGLHLDPASADAETIRTNITTARKAAKMSQAEMGKAMASRGHEHWRQTTVSRVETGRQAIKVAEMETLSEILGVSVIEGTGLAQSSRDLGRQAREQAVLHRVRQVEESLLDALQMLGDIEKYVHAADELVKRHPLRDSDDGHMWGPPMLERRARELADPVFRARLERGEFDGEEGLVRYAEESPSMAGTLLSRYGGTYPRVAPRLLELADGERQEAR